MNEAERAELDAKKAGTEATEASTYKTYIDAGVLDASEVRHLKYGDTLGDMPGVTKLPEVEGEQ